MSLCIVVTKSNHLWTIITLTMQQVHAKKFLGQHFLTDLSIAQRIANQAYPQQCSTDGHRQSDRAKLFTREGKGENNPIQVLEVGPGMGVLTQFLLKDPNIQLTAIEIDRESVAYLKEW